MEPMRRLQATTVPLDAVKLGKRRRSENEYINESDLINVEEDAAIVSENSNCGLSKRQKLNLAGDKWQCSFAPTVRKSSLVEPVKSSFPFSLKKRDVKRVGKNTVSEE